MTIAAMPSMSLTRSQHELADLSVLEPLALRIARAMQGLLDNRTNGVVTMAAGTATAARYPEWRIAQNPFGALLRFRLSNRNEEVLIYVPGHLVSQIVDLHYGGNGTVQIRSEFTPAEIRFVDRFGEQLAPLLQAIFEPGETAGFEFIETHIDLLYASWPKSRDAVVVQTLMAEGEAIKSAVIGVVMAAETVRMIEERRGADESFAAPADSAWTERMHAAAMRVRLPARTVLTRSEVPFDKLLTLAPGDILPVLLPTQIPLIVGGHVYAHGSLGEANGRAALLIETIEKDLDR